MAGPTLVVVDEDSRALSDVERELRDRYARHYSVIAMPSSDEALARLRDLAAAGEPVALVLAGQWLSGMTGSELLDEARHLHPHAKRGLLIPWGGWGDRPTGEAIFDSIAHGRIDHYVLRPEEPPNELFHHAISVMLLEWAEAQRTSPYTVHVVADSWAGRAYELREYWDAAPCRTRSAWPTRTLVARSWPRRARASGCRWSSFPTAPC